MDDRYTSKLSPTVDFWAGIYLLIIAILSVLGNAAILLDASRRVTPLKAPELLTVNLALTDIGMALSMYPLSIASAFNHTWLGGDASCLYYGLMGMLFSVTSIMTLTVMGMVRYMVTGSPPKSGMKFQRQTIYIVITGIWLYAILWAVFPLLGWGSYGPEPFGLACSINWTGYWKSLSHSTFILTLSILCTFLPTVVLVFSYFGIAWKLHKAYQSIQSNGIPRANVEKRVTLMAVLISLGFLVAWTPYVVVSYWSMFHTQDEAHMSPFITMLPCLFAKSATMYNPLLHFIFRCTAWQNPPQFQARRFICCHRSRTATEEQRIEMKMVDGCELSVISDRIPSCVGQMGHTLDTQTRCEITTLAQQC